MDVSWIGLLYPGIFFLRAIATSANFPRLGQVCVLDPFAGESAGIALAPVVFACHARNLRLDW